MPHPPQVDHLTWKVVYESGVTWATTVPILVFLGLCSRLRPDICDRQMSDRQTSDTHPHLMPPPYGGGGGHNKCHISYDDDMYITYRWHIVPWLMPFINICLSYEVHV